MCTVILIARRHGWALGMNRDEKLGRVAGLPPVVHRAGRRQALFPSEPGGGAWVGVNDAGAGFALINWYAVSARVPGRAVSRGEVVTAALAAASPAEAAELLRSLPLARVNPFRLIGVFPEQRAVAEWRWNLKRLERLDHRWRTGIWISSGFDEPGAQQTRGKAFRKALRRRSAGSLGWLRRLHRSHAPEIGPYSVCMHREDAATVSYTEIVASGRAARVRYQPGPPCRRGPVFDTVLARARSGGSADLGTG